MAKSLDGQTHRQMCSSSKLYILLLAGSFWQAIHVDVGLARLTRVETRKGTQGEERKVNANENGGNDVPYTMPGRGCMVQGSWSREIRCRLAPVRRHTDTHMRARVVPLESQRRCCIAPAFPVSRLQPRRAPVCADEYAQ